MHGVHGARQREHVRGVAADSQEDGIGAINWGLVQGKAQTHLPWDSWRRPYVDREPAVWFHEVFRNDGTPYDAKETALIKSLTAVPVAR